MALANYLTPNSYTVIDQIVYSKVHSFVQFQTLFFSSPTKDILLGEKQHRIENRYTVTALLHKGLNTPPSDAKDGDSYRIGPEPTGVWANYPNKVAKATAGSWGFWILGPNEEFFVVPEQRYYKHDINLALVPTSCPFDSREFNKFFSQELIDEFGLQAQAYKYLKSCPGFENVVDI
jgi:hypothetical protein